MCSFSVVCSLLSLFFVVESKKKEKKVVGSRFSFERGRR
jgi:hypothetical protein